jgi:hypothetical protein
MSWTDGITVFFVSDGTLIPHSDGCLGGVMRCSKQSHLFDHVVGAQQE